MSENFEEKIKKAEEILANLNKDELTLAQSIALHKQGQVLIEEAREILEKAKLEVVSVDE
ncbi:exodeoxyribonuclease VII small subunit [Campylobacter gastrosuis]|uniref:Exodeoxyribonuclease VII small subunit n=1 Tax=Campylobacter gastrosuis TaxID=2974576 RepID=A0ABT7HPF0_9BACT|nr:exodeoxyribonuclease VII small subunit [Campylobacter gastrosuis]MDL0088812.1 exodeoxyribonuclease VII small subunit [Campylobacter gastrosuis]